MKRLMIGVTVLALLASPAAIAQPDQHHGQRSEKQQHDGRQYHAKSGRWENGKHRGWGRERGHKYHWGRGQQMGYYDWRRAERVDYRRYHLRQPPRGYEWRRSDDRYILAAVATGVIISVILTSGR